MRAMRGKTLETVTISTVLWVHKELPQSTVKLVLPNNESYDSKTGCNRTLPTVLWVPLTPAVESSIAVEEAVENRGLWRIFVSPWVLKGFPKHYSTTIARLGPPSGLEQGG